MKTATKRYTSFDGTCDCDRQRLSSSKCCILHSIARAVNKKLSYRREAARCFVSLSILLDHSRSFMVIGNSTTRQIAYEFLLAFHIVNMALSCIISEIQQDTDFSYI